MTEKTTQSPTNEPAVTSTSEVTLMESLNSNYRNVPLKTAIKIGDKEFNELYIRKPLGGDLRGLAIADVLRSDVDSMAKLLPRINTNFIISPEMVYAMDLSDLTEVFTQVASFLK